MNTDPIIHSLSSSGFQVPPDYFNTLASRTLNRMEPSKYTGNKSLFFNTLRISLASAATAFIILISALLIPVSSDTTLDQSETNELYLSVVSRNIESYVLIHQLCQDAELYSIEENLTETDLLMDEIILNGSPF